MLAANTRPAVWEWHSSSRVSGIGILSDKNALGGNLALIIGAGFGAAAVGALVAILMTSDYRAESREAYRVAQEEMNSGTGQQPPRAMLLEGQFNGPLRDTVIQRWRDPIDGTVCYIYLPVAVAQQPGPSGLVQYGAANIGSISCLP